MTEKSYLQELYKALFGAELAQGSDARTRKNPYPLTTPPPPPGEGGENRVPDGLTYTDSPGGYSPQKTPRATFVGVPASPPAKPPVGDVCQAVQNGPQRLLELLQQIARSILPPGNRDLWRKVGTVVFMVPQELLALHLGVSRQTVWAWKLELEATGLIASDVLYQKVEGKQRAIGTLWAVRLRPGKARLDREDYLHPWRNLALDMSNGVLSYTWVRAHEEKGIRPTLDTLVLWAQGKRVVPNTKSVAVDLGLINVLPEVEEAKRPMLITLLSTYLSQLFDDHRSRRFYAGLMWAVVRGELPAHFVFGLVIRTLRDYQEGLITRPGAFIAKTLKTLRLQEEAAA